MPGPEQDTMVVKLALVELLVHLMVAQHRAVELGKRTLIVM